MTSVDAVDKSVSGKLAEGDTLDGKSASSRPRTSRSTAEAGSTHRKTADASNPRPLRRLNQHHLEVFNAIVSTGSITAAARLLNISQPGVSRSLSNLEHEIGFAL